MAEAPSALPHTGAAPPPAATTRRDVRFGHGRQTTPTTEIRPPPPRHRAAAARSLGAGPLPGASSSWGRRRLENATPGASPAAAALRKRIQHARGGIIFSAATPAAAAAAAVAPVARSRAQVLLPPASAGNCREVRSRVALEAHLVAHRGCTPRQLVLRRCGERQAVVVVTAPHCGLARGTVAGCHRCDGLAPREGGLLHPRLQGAASP